MRAVARSLPDRRAGSASPTLAKKRLIRVAAGGRRFEVRRRPGVVPALDSGQIAVGCDVGAATVLEDGEPVAFDEPFWFAVAAFQPDAWIVTS